MAPLKRPTPGSSWRAWTRALAGADDEDEFDDDQVGGDRAESARIDNEVVDVDTAPANDEAAAADEFDLDLVWPATPTGAPAHMGDERRDDERGDRSVHDVSETRPRADAPTSTSMARRAEDKAAATAPAAGTIPAAPLLPALASRLAALEESVGAISSRLDDVVVAMSSRLDDLVDTLETFQASVISAVEPPPAPELPPIASPDDVAATTASVQRVASDLDVLRSELRDVSASAHAIESAVVALQEQGLKARTDSATTHKLDAVAESVDSTRSELQLVQQELAALRRRVGLRAKPPTLDDEAADALAAALVERLVQTFDVKIDEPESTRSSRRRR